MLIDERESFIVRIDVNRPAMNRFYQLMRASDFYGQISWEFKLGIKAPVLIWQGVCFEQDSIVSTLTEHLPALQSFLSRMSIVPLLKKLSHPSSLQRKESLSFSTRQG
jgi:hypothetical protein